MKNLYNSFRVLQKIISLLLFTAKFYRSVFEIQKAVAKELSTPEGRKRPVQQRVQEVKKFIKIAVNGGSLDFARSLLGKGLYLYIKVQ